MTAPGRCRRSLVAAATACASALVVVGVAACGGGSDQSASDRGDGATRAPSTTGAPDRDVEPTTTTATGEPAPSAAPVAETVPGVPGEAISPVPLDATAAVGNGVEIRLSGIEAVEADAHLPGEISGPAVAVTVEIVNGSSAPIDLGYVTVDLVTAAGASASPVLDPDRGPLAGPLDPGGTRAGSYVFTLGPDERDDVSVRVRYSVDSPTAVFIGGVPHG